MVLGAMAVGRRLEDRLEVGADWLPLLVEWLWMLVDWLRQLVDWLWLLVDWLRQLMYWPRQLMYWLLLLVDNTDDAAARATASVASLEAVLVAATPQVVDAGVDDDGQAADIGLGGGVQRDDSVLDGDVRHAVVPGDNVAQVAHMTLVVQGSAVVPLLARRNKKLESESMVAVDGHPVSRAVATDSSWSSPGRTNCPRALIPLRFPP